MKEKIQNFILFIKNVIQRIPKKVKIITAIVLVIVLICCVIFVWISNENKKQKYVAYNGKNIKESKYPGYKELLDALQERHPNWEFTLLYTRLDWSEVIKNEGHKDNTAYPLNLIPDSTEYPEDWRCEIDKDKTFDNGTWLCASDKAIAYQMDPRNILKEENVFQFAELIYVEGAQTAEGLGSITQGSFLEGEAIAEALLQAGKKANVDPYFIASRLIQEQGREGTTLSRGYEYKESLVYNVFNIGASGNSREEILENAAQYAYSQGWDSIEKALIGGVEFIKDAYINVGQNTLYLQKFDVVNQDGSLYTHQYMQNLLAPQSEASNMRAIYESSNTVDASLHFIVPLYENMPETVSER